MAHSFAVEGIDHVELFVSDWDDAATWYERVLGITPAEAFEQWRETDTGPLMLSVDDTTKLALFERPTATRGEAVSPHRVAFRTDADGFLTFLNRLETLELTNREGELVTTEDVIDHGRSYSKIGRAHV